jgi:hypothetical protein
MKPEIEQYEKSIKKKHSFGWTPKYEEETRTELPPKVFSAIVAMTFEKLGWELVFQDAKHLEAKKKGKWNTYTEKISISYEFGKVNVRSVALGNEMWDNGRNSKRVKLFIYAFKETESGFSRENLVDLEKEVERKNNWDDYQIPEKLPHPLKQNKPRIQVALLGGISLSIFLGFLIAYSTIKIGYTIVIFEIIVAILISLVFVYLIKLSNYTNYANLRKVLLGTIILTYFFNQYFFYELIMYENSYTNFSFFDFIELRFEEGFTLESFNTGWVGLVISWMFQIGFTQFFSEFLLVSSLAKYSIGKVPPEVIDFAMFHFVKEKTEPEVRTELSKMGWSKTQDQNDVFEAIGAVFNANEINRMG